MSAVKATKLSSANNPYHSFIEGKDPMRVLASTANRLAKLIAGLTARQASSRVIADKWSIHEIIAHLADVELVHSTRCRFILFEENPPLVAFDQDAWARGWLRESEPVGETLERFRALRQSQLRLFRSASGQDLRRTGLHSERGVESLGDYIAKSAGHDLNHLPQVVSLRERILSRS